MSANEFSKVIDSNFKKFVQLHTSISMMTEHDSKPELFQKLLDKDYDINYRIPDSYNIFYVYWLVDETIFDIYGTTDEVCQAMIDHGADYTWINKEGTTVLLDKITRCGYDSYLNSINLRDWDPDDEEKSYANVILSAHVNSKNHKNPKNKNGLSHFHVACMWNRQDVAKFFIENGVSVNESVEKDSKFYPGYSALHFAAKSCAVETSELLLTLDADMFAEDAKGMTPLHVLIVERRKKIITLKRLSKEHLEQNKEDRSRYLRICNYFCNNKEIIYLFLERMDQRQSNLKNDTGLTKLHILCFMGNTSSIQQLLDKNKEEMLKSVSKNSPIWPGYTPLHFAAHSNVETVEILMRKGANLFAKDANGETPFELCLREFTIVEIHRILLLQPDYINIVFSDGKTKLSDYICSMQELISFEDFLTKNLKCDINTFIPFDSPICAGQTPLHLAIICAEQPMNWNLENHDHPYDLFEDLASKESQTHISRIDMCLRHNADVTTRNAKGLTPLHWAFRLQQNQVVHRLLKRHDTNSNYVDEHGLSHLHIACAAKNDNIVTKLLQAGANVNGTVKSSYTWLDVPIVNGTKYNTYKYVMKEGSTPLHFASTVKCSKIVEILVSLGADVLAQNADGLNPLEILFGVPIFNDSDRRKPSRSSFYDAEENKIVNLLVRKIGDKLVNTNPKQMLYCYSLLNDDLLKDILSYGDVSAMKILESIGVTILHAACFTRNLPLVIQLIDKIDVNASVHLESPLWPGYTALHFLKKSRLTTKNEKKLSRILLQHGADVVALNAKGETPIHQAFRQRSWYHVGELFRNLKDFSVNPTSKHGYTHLHIASECGLLDIVEKLLDHEALIDQPIDYFKSDVGGFTALHCAAYRQRDNIVDVLLKRGANVNWSNAYGSNVLHVANWEHRQPCLKILQTLIKAGADIHARNMYGETPLEVLIKSRHRIREEIELFLEHDSHVNIVNSMSDEGLLAIAINKSLDISVFDILVKVPDVKDMDIRGRNAIHHVVSFKRPGWNDLEVWSIDEIYTPSDAYIKGIASLIDLGLNIDHQDYNGLTPLHVAAKMQNLTGIIGLLESGADINIVDAEGKSAFSYSIELAQPDKDLMELDLRILKVISTHIFKLSLADISISTANRAIDMAIREAHPLNESTISACYREIEKLSEKGINNTSITYYQFLSDTGAVSAFPYMLLDKRVVIICTFKSEVESIRETFPELIGVLLLQYRKALARRKIIDPAVTSLNLLLGFNVPAICSRLILRFLNNDELNSLINSTF